jgi:hypothetical protein
VAQRLKASMEPVNITHVICDSGVMDKGLDCDDSFDSDIDWFGPRRLSSKII